MLFTTEHPINAAWWIGKGHAESRDFMITGKFKDCCISDMPPKLFWCDVEIHKADSSL
jgi:hypothetical protein